MLPLSDENPISLTPFINWMIIGSCIVVFIWQSSSGSDFFISSILSFGLVPERIMAGEGLYTFLTNMFLHGGWSHLLGNMLFLWIFGDNIEDCCGHIRYLAFYILAGVAASAIWMFTVWGSPYPAVGASGAISGVMGAYFVLYPKARIRALVSIGLFWRVIRVRAYAMIGLWFVYQFLLGLVPINTGVAYWAHIGGFIAGIILAKTIRPKLRKPVTYNSLEYYR